MKYYSISQVHVGLTGREGLVATLRPTGICRVLRDMQGVYRYNIYKLMVHTLYVSSKTRQVSVLRPTMPNVWGSEPNRDKEKIEHYILKLYYLAKMISIYGK